MVQGYAVKNAPKMIGSELGAFCSILHQLVGNNHPTKRTYWGNGSGNRAASVVAIGQQKRCKWWWIRRLKIAYSYMH